MKDSLFVFVSAAVRINGYCSQTNKGRLCKFANLNKCKLTFKAVRLSAKNMQCYLQFIVLA